MKLVVWTSREVKVKLPFLAKRVNTPPKAIVQPVFQTVNLPTTKAIIDGSPSTDDSSDLKFRFQQYRDSGRGGSHFEHPNSDNQKFFCSDLG